MLFLGEENVFPGMLKVWKDEAGLTPLVFLLSFICFAENCLRALVLQVSNDVIFHLARFCVIISVKNTSPHI